MHEEELKISRENKLVQTKKEVRILIHIGMMNLMKKKN